MEFDARNKAPDAVGWECKVIMPDGETVAVKLRDFAKIPGAISIDNMGDSEGQLWGSLEWGVIEPKHWPVESEGSVLQLFRKLPMDVNIRLHREWQKNAGVSLGESSDSNPSSENTETS